MVEELKFFKNKKIFLTGHTGFKGSWLSIILHEIGADVTGFSLPPITQPNNFELSKLKEKINHIEGDIRDFKLLNTSLQECKPDIVIHLAAQALVRKSYNEPVDTFSTNIMGSVNLLEAVRNCDTVRSLVFITSDKCYENVEWVWGYRENDPMGGHDPYSASKGAAELIFSAYMRSYFLKKSNLGIASARAGNVIGGGDWSEDRIIPDCIRAIERREKIILRNPNATRPWQHVLEPLSGYLSLARNLYEKPAIYTGSWNFGPLTNNVRTVYEVADSIVQSFGKGEIEIISDGNKVHEANLLQLNCDKAHQLMNWYPRWEVDITLQQTANWYKEILSGKDAYKTTKNQIIEYFKEGKK